MSGESYQQAQRQHTTRDTTRQRTNTLAVLHHSGKQPQVCTMD